MEKVLQRNNSFGVFLYFAISYAILFGAIGLVFFVLNFIIENLF